MKHGLDPYLRLAAVFFGGSLLVSFFFTVLYYFNWMGTRFYQLGCLFCGVILYAVCGIIFARQAKKKVLLQALVLLALIFIIGFFLMESHDWKAVASLAARGLCLIAGCAVVVGRH